MKVAIIHYWFMTRRGGEKVVESLLKIYPEADIYTLFYDKHAYGEFLNNHKVYTSVLNTAFLRKHYQKIFPFYPLGIKSLKLAKKYDLIISSESGPAKGINIKQATPHLCYVHTPMRYCYSHTADYVASVKPIFRPLLRFFLGRLKQWDLSTVDNVDLYLANSYNIAHRIKRYYNRDSAVVYPPIADALFAKPLTNTQSDIYLSFGAITPYKRIDLLIDVFNKNKKQLVIIGEGSEREKLEKKAKQNIQFKGALAWEKIEHYFSRSKALIFPGDEDFGMIPVEVMAYGIPVIAFKKGGALETIIENRAVIKESTGLFFDHQNEKSIQETIEFFEVYATEFDHKFIRNHAKKFSEEIFINTLKNHLKKING